jgi:hypothetical protein
LCIFVFPDIGVEKAICTTTVAMEQVVQCWPLAAAHSTKVVTVGLGLTETADGSWQQQLLVGSSIIVLTIG